MAHLKRKCTPQQHCIDKLQLTGQNLGQVFNSRSGCMCAMGINSYETKWPNLKLETRPKQLSGSIPLAFVLLILGGTWGSLNIEEF